jgi:hypothetical protein
MDIGKCFKDAWGLFRIDLGPLIAAAVIAAVVMGIVNFIIGLVFFGSAGALAQNWSALAWGSAFFGIVLMGLVGILAYAWMYAVVFHMMLRRIRGQRPAEYADMQSFDQIGAFAVAGVVLGIIISIGYFLLIIPGLLLTTIWLYALPLIGDRRLTLSEAMAESRKLAGVPGLFTTFAAWLVAAVAVFVVIAILNTIPVVGFVVGLLAVPFGIGYVISMYFQAIGEGQLVTAAIESAQH